MLICPNCGQENPEIARFCLACATLLAPAPVVREERKIVTVLFADLVGFNTGEALVALTARPETGEGMALGDVVNTAQRLESMAPANSVLVGEQTFHATSQAIEYRGVEPILVKGKAQPVKAWEPLAL